MSRRVMSRIAGSFEASRKSTAASRAMTAIRYAAHASGPGDEAAGRGRTGRRSSSGAWRTVRLRRVPEARLEDSGAGLKPAEAGWFVVNVRDAGWRTSESFGSDCTFESKAARFEQLGINISVLEPG